MISEYVDDVIHSDVNISNVTDFWDGWMADHESYSQDPYNIVGKIGGTITILMIIVGILGNFQVLVLIARCPRLHKSYNAFIASLSFSDLIFNSLMMPLYVDSYLHRTWRFSYVLCQIHTYFGAMVLMSSGLHIGLIAINRYLLIVHRTLYSVFSSHFAVCFQVALVWLTSFLTVLPGILGWQAVVGYTDQVSRCNYLRQESVVTLLLIFSIGFVFPCTIMLYCYVMIWRQLLSDKFQMSLNAEKKMYMKSTRRRRRHQVERSITSGDRMLQSNSETDGTTGLFYNVRGIMCEHQGSNQLCVCDKSKLSKSKASINSQWKQRFRSSSAMIKNKRSDNTVSPKSSEKYLTVSAYKKSPKLQENEMRVLSSLQLNSNGESGNSESKITEKSSISNSDTSCSGVNGNDTTSNSDQQVLEIETAIYISADNGKQEIEQTDEKKLHIVDSVILITGANNRTHRPKSDVKITKYRLSNANRQKLNSIRMIFVIFLAFFFTYLPFIIVNMIGNSNKINRNWYMITSLGFWAGSVVNPIIYGIMNSQFRKAYAKMVSDTIRKIRNCIAEIH